MSKYRCCGTDMTAVVTGRADPEPRVVHLCLFCELRLIQVDLPPRRSSVARRLGGAITYPAQPARVDSFKPGPLPVR